MEDKDFIVEIARLISRRNMTIAEFYEALGVDLDNYREGSADDVVAQLAGIFTGWENPREG